MIDLDEMLDDKFKQDYEDYLRTRIGVKASFFDDDNPHIWDLFLKYTREMPHSGRTRYSANMIFERIRWHTTVETRGTDFKISNDFRAYYSRKIMALHPEFRGFFSVKEPRQ